LDVHFISSKDNLADIFIKPTTLPYFSLMRTKLNVVYPLSRLRGHNEPSKEKSQHSIQGNQINTQRLAKSQEGNPINSTAKSSTKGNQINTNG
jgi:hypothetical protein